MVTVVICLVIALPAFHLVSPTLKVETHGCAYHILSDESCSGLGEWGNWSKQGFLFSMLLGIELF